MGILKSGFQFVMGTFAGIYIAQNYNVPNIQNVINWGLVIAKHTEESYRKPKKPPKSDSDGDH